MTIADLYNISLLHEVYLNTGVSTNLEVTRRDLLTRSLVTHRVNQRQSVFNEIPLISLPEHSFLNDRFADIKVVSSVDESCVFKCHRTLIVHDLPRRSMSICGKINSLIYQILTHTTGGGHSSK